MKGVGLPTVFPGRGLQRLEQLARGPSLPGWRDQAPQQTVVEVTAAVVAHRGANGLREAVQAAEQIFYRLSVQLRMFLERCIQPFDVDAMVLIVVDAHRPGVDVGFEGLRCIR